jgi:hypothetical protein
MGQSRACGTVCAMRRNTAQATTPTPQNGTVRFCRCPLASATRDLGQANLSGSVAHLSLSRGSASLPLYGLHRSRAMLLADRLDRSPLQVMAHRIRPGTGHEVGRAARVSPKRSRQGIRLSPRPQQRHVPLPGIDGPLWRARSAGWVCRLLCLPWS